MVHPDRVKIHTPETQAGGMVIYRMSRDQRVGDNWALLFAQKLAESTGRSFAVVFTLMPSYPISILCCTGSKP
jgi:deoxyribodipyrimidine photo-lyase